MDLKDMRELEADLGCALLVRGGRGVVPTQAGLALYQDALDVLDAAAEAGQRARRVGLEQEREVRLGLVQTARKYGFLHAGLAAFNRDFPSAGVALTRGLSRDLAQCLRQGALDATLLYERHAAAERFRDRLVHRERYVLAAHRAHTLARPGAARLEELAGVPLDCVLRHDTANNHNFLIEHCRLHGLDPVVARWANSPEEMFDFVAISGGVCITPASTMLLLPPGQLVFRALADFTLELELRLAWADPAADAASAFAARLNEAIDQHQAGLRDGTGAGTVLDGVALYRVDAARAAQ